MLKQLNSYLSRVNPEVIDCCPSCQGTPHNTQHLFDCPANPTDCTPTMLWTHPVAIAAFLGLDLGESDTTSSSSINSPQ